MLSAVERAARAHERGLGKRVYAIERVRLANGEPVALERGSYAVDLYPGLIDEPLDGSLYELIRARYADVPVRAQERLEPALAQSDEAAALGIEAGAPVMLVERTAYAASGVPVEISRDVFRGDRTRIVWESDIS
ncbi:MAG: GntR family transcriptional regulator [Gaiellaceae bacterium]|nr:GntR family transcriptional regulator [Gaiellaceae bacterium]